MRNYQFVALICLGIAACSGGGNTSNPSPAPIVRTVSNADIQSINSLITEFLNANAQNKIVGSVSRETRSGEDVHVFEFTDGTETSAPSRLIQSVVEDGSSWRATVTFIDTQSHAFFFQASALGLSNNDIVLDPFGNAPLSARAQFSTPVPGQIQVLVRGQGTNGITMSHEFGFQGTNFDLPILGLYADYANQVEFRFSDVAGNELVTETLSVQTEAISIPFSVNILQNQLSADDDGVYMVSDTKLAFDQRGEVRWALTDPDVNYVFRKLANGNLTATNADRAAVYHFGAFTETTMLGEVVERYDVQNMIHHEVRLDEQKNTYFIAGNSFPVINGLSFVDGFPEEDLVQEIDRTTQQVINQWDFNFILDPYRIGINDPVSRPEDWAHINAVYYDDEDNSIVISARSQSTVAKIDYDTGRPVWLLGAHQHWPPNLEHYLLTPIDADGNSLDINTPDFWPSAQHAPVKLPNGDILLYDNGNNRGLYTGEPDARYSRVAQYRIDQDAMTVQLIDIFPDHQDWYTLATGDVDFLPQSGGRLVSFLWGSAQTPRLLELNADGEIVFEAMQDIGMNYYRAEKFRLYDGIE